MLVVDDYTQSLIVGGSFTTFGELTRYNLARMGLAEVGCAGIAGCGTWLKA